MGKRKVGRRGLALKEVQKLERLIASGVDRQTILQSTGVSISTLRKAERHLLPAQRQRKLYGRCKKCGVWVKLPCVVCHVKRLQRAWSMVKLIRKERAKQK